MAITLFYMKQKSTLCATEIEPLDRFITRSGLSRVTAWRWRKRGWLETITIAGRQYITAEARARFLERAHAGDFAGTAPPPSTKGGDAE